MLSYVGRLAYIGGVERKRSDTSNVPAVTSNDYIALAGLLQGRGSVQRVQKKDPLVEGLRASGEFYANREFVSAYECLKPAHDKVVAAMQRLLARNLDFEVNKLARQQHLSHAAAKESVQATKAHAQQVIDGLNRLLHDLESKPLVRAHVRRRESSVNERDAPVREASPTAERQVEEATREAPGSRPVDLISGKLRLRQMNYSAPEIGSIYAVRDRTGRKRIIQVVEIDKSRTNLSVVAIEDGEPSKQAIQITVDSLARQAAKGWCSVLVPVDENTGVARTSDRPIGMNTDANVTMRLDSQNFGRCCADIVRAKIKFSTQLIKDVADGPFRAGNYEQAFLTFEQLAVGFNSAVASSRRAIADGRRMLTAEKGKISGKEIQERTAGFIRSEQLIHAAEREFATILEGLRMYLRAQQGNIQGEIDAATNQQ
ncbi:MAG TPA: hypothetical protein VHE81_11585 [Lacipirellulaceae bacterium]|nr:hypothetical protein [Lacipirellulaceae bacterium]